MEIIDIFKGALEMTMLEDIENVISETTKTGVNGMPVEQVDELIEQNEKAIGCCDLFINRVINTLELKLIEVDTIEKSLEGSDDHYIPLTAVLTELNTMRTNIYRLSELRAMLAARNAALT